jgi:hypothetical protein
VSETLTVTLRDKEQAKTALQHVYKTAHASLIDGKPMTVTLKPQTRSDAQRMRMWGMLRDLSEQVDWYGHKLTADEWKDVVTAGIKKQKAVPGIEGGFVVLGDRTSDKSVKWTSELMQYIEAFGASKDVVFTRNGER